MPENRQPALCVLSRQFTTHNGGCGLPNTHETVDLIATPVGSQRPERVTGHSGDLFQGDCHFMGEMGLFSGTPRATIVLASL